MNIRPKTVLMAGALIAAASTTLAQADTSRDERITRGVIQKLSEDARMSGRGHIDVVTRDGTVILTGNVPVPSISDRAERDASAVAGVREVDNELVTRIGGEF